MVDIGATSSGNFALGLLAILLLSAVAHADSTQQYNKLYLNPFYVQSISAGGSTDFTVDINPPDGVARIVSAIVGFNAQINGQTQNFTLRVNGVACRPSSYYVATAFSTTGNIQFYFDCTNAINNTGTDNLNIASAVATGAISGWLDLTYMNNPKGQVKYVGGTEYTLPDNLVTPFLSLVDANGVAIDSAVCKMDIYNSYASNITHNALFSDFVLAHKNKGLFYADFYMPNITGVYMVDASCAYVQNPVFYYPAIELAATCGDKLINETVNVGTKNSGNVIFLNSYEDFEYESFSSTAGGTKSFSVTWVWNNTGTCMINKTLITALDFLFSGENSIALTTTFEAFNWTSSSYVTVGSLAMKASLAGGIPSGFDNYIDLPLDINSFVSSAGVVNIRANSTAGSTFTFAPNWATLLSISNSSVVVNSIRGSGEIHINPAFNTTNIAQAVWNFTVRNLTDYNSTQIYSAILQMNGTLYNVYIVSNTTNATSYNNYLLLLGINSTSAAMLSTLGQINGTVNSILALSSEINLTAHQTLALASSLNLTADQILALALQINASADDISYVVHQNNITLHQILAFVNATNTTVSAILSISSELNLSGLQILQVAMQSNLTANQILQIVRQMNETVNGMNLTTGQIAALAYATNQTVDQVLGIVQALNISINQTISGNITLNTNLTSGTIDSISQKVWMQFLTLGTPPILPSTSYACLDNDTLLKNNTFQVCTSSGCSQFSKVDQTHCSYGCDRNSNTCMADPATMGLVLFGFLIFVIVPVAIIWLMGRRRS